MVPAYQYRIRVLPVGALLPSNLQSFFNNEVTQVVAFRDLPYVRMSYYFVLLAPRNDYTIPSEFRNFVVRNIVNTRIRECSREHGTPIRH